MGKVSQNFLLRVHMYHLRRICINEKIVIFVILRILLLSDKNLNYSEKLSAVIWNLFSASPEEVFGENSIFLYFYTFLLLRLFRIWANKTLLFAKCSGMAVITAFCISRRTISRKTVLMWNKNNFYSIFFAFWAVTSSKFSRNFLTASSKLQ